MQNSMLFLEALPEANFCQIEFQEAENAGQGRFAQILGRSWAPFRLTLGTFGGLASACVDFLDIFLG